MTARNLTQRCVKNLPETAGGAPMTARNPLDELSARAQSNPVAEAAIIAGLVNCGDPKIIADYVLRHQLEADWFTIEAYRRAYAVILSLSASGSPVDMPILAQHLSQAEMAAVDSARREHVSSANFDNYAEILKKCQRNRLVQAARERLAKALAAGCTPNELRPILDSIEQASQGTKKPRATFTGLHELLSTPPAENWLVKSWIPSDSIIVIFGDSGTGKSFVAIDLLCHIAAGIPWLGSETRKGPVLYIAGEGQNGIIRRFKAWFERHGHQDAASNILLRTLPAALCDATATAALVEEIAAMPIKPLAVAIDTLARNFGPGDENATRDMNQFVAGLDAIRLATQAALVVPHHSGHAEKTRARGSSVLKAAIDTEFCIEKDGDTVSMRCPKMKDSEAPPPVAWTLTRQTLPWADETGAPLNSAVLTPVDAKLTRFHRHLTRPQRIALDTLTLAVEQHGSDGKVLSGDWKRVAVDAGLTLSESRQGKHKAFTQAVEALVDAGMVAVDGNWFSLAQRQPVNQTSTNSKLVDKVDAGIGVNLSTPLKGGVDKVDAPTQPNHCAEPQGEVAAKWRSGGDSGEPLDPNRPDSPLAQRILATLASQPGGFDRADLARIVGNGKGASAAMIDTEVNRLLLARRIATANGKLVLEVRP